MVDWMLSAEAIRRGTECGLPSSESCTNGDSSQLLPDGEGYIRRTIQRRNRHLYPSASLAISQTDAVVGMFVRMIVCEEGHAVVGGRAVRSGCCCASKKVFRIVAGRSSVHSFVTATREVTLEREGKLSRLFSADAWFHDVIPKSRDSRASHDKERHQPPINRATSPIKGETRDGSKGFIVLCHYISKMPIRRRHAESSAFSSDFKTP